MESIEIIGRAGFLANGPAKIGLEWLERVARSTQQDQQSQNFINIEDVRDTSRSLGVFAACKVSLTRLS